MNTSSPQDRWLLPEGVDEALPDEARRLERARRRLLDLYATWGYEQVMPPFIEFLDSLLIGSGSDLDIETFKLIDQMSGRLMGVRADITPQVARIDASRMDSAAPRRFCYIGTVLHTRPDGVGGSRSPLQVGAEIFGHHGVDSDVEIILLMVDSLRQLGVSPLHVDLGHVAIYRELALKAGLTGDTEAECFRLLQRKALPELNELLARLDLKPNLRAMLAELGRLHGGGEVLARARQVFAAEPDLGRHLDYLQAVAHRVATEAPDVELNFDLAELRGYHYKNGIVFAAFVPGHGRELARGGRYDNIGGVFGRARPATGFSMDLKRVIGLAAGTDTVCAGGIFVPSALAAAAAAEIRRLRMAGERVVVGLSGLEPVLAAEGCDRELQSAGKAWSVVSRRA